MQPEDEFYCDTCLADYEGNVHFNIHLLDKIVPKSLRKQIYCMHIDSEKLPNKIKDKGFNVVESI